MMERMRGWIWLEGEFQERERSKRRGGEDDELELTADSFCF